MTNITIISGIYSERLLRKRRIILRDFVSVALHISKFRCLQLPSTPFNLELLNIEELSTTDLMNSKTLLAIIFLFVGSQRAYMPCHC